MRLPRLIHHRRPAQERRLEVISLDELGLMYDFTRPDLFVGAESNRYVLHYGGPTLWASSEESKVDMETDLFDDEDPPDDGTPFHIRAERMAWRTLIERSRKSRDRGKPSSDVDQG